MELRGKSAQKLLDWKICLAGKGLCLLRLRVFEVALGIADKQGFASTQTLGWLFLQFCKICHVRHPLSLSTSRRATARPVRFIFRP